MFDDFDFAKVLFVYLFPLAKLTHYFFKPCVDDLNIEVFSVITKVS